MNGCLSDKDIDRYFESALKSETLPSNWQTHIDRCMGCQSRIDSELLFRDLKDAVRNNNLSSVGGSRNGKERGSLEEQQPNETPVELNLPAIPGYEIGEKIQHGGQGIVYRALQTTTKREVAIKFLREGAFALSSNRNRFETEIETVANLRHPNIVTIYDSGSVEGLVYFSMEFVDGKTFNSFCDQHSENHFKSGATSKAYVREILGLFLKIVQAIAYAHRNSVIHHDIKPANIIVDFDLEPQILDFGLSRIADNIDARVVANELKQKTTGEFFGTPAYASPEQVSIRPGSVDTRSDIYSLGVVLFESLTKRFPYSVSGTLFSVAKEIQCQPPRFPSKLNHAIDDEVETILLKSLAKEPEHRYQTAEQFAFDIEAYLGGRPIDAMRTNHWYVLRKEIRRNWPIALSILLTIAFLTAALTTSNYFFRRAVLDRDIAIQAKTATSSALNEASSQRVEAEFQSCVANLSAASGSIQLDDVVECATRLMKVPLDKRGWEWHHFLHLLDDSRSTIATHTHYAEFVSFGESQSQIISSGQGGQIIVSNAKDQKGPRILVRDEKGPIAISPDRRFLAFSAKHGSMKVCRVNDFKEIAILQTGGNLITAISFSTDGKLLAAGIVTQGMTGTEEIAIEIWEIDTGNRVMNIPFSMWHVNAISFSPDQSLFSAVTFEGASVWNFQTGERVTKLPDRPGNESVVRFGPNGDIIATGGKEGTIYLWSVLKKELVAELVGHRGEITDVEFCGHQDRLVSSSRDKTIRVWDLAKGTTLKTYKGHRWAISEIDVWDNGKVIASASWDQTIRLWDGVESRSRSLLDGHSSQVATLDFSPNGSRFASASRDHTIKIWRTHDRKLLHTIDRHGSPAHGVKFSHDGRLLATTGWNQEAAVWDTSTWEQVADLKGHDLHARVHGVAFSKDDKWMVTGGSDNKLLIWDTDSFRLKKSLVGHTDHIHTVSVSPNNQFIASAGHESIRIWNTVDFSLLHVLPRRMLQDDYSLAFHPTENWLAAGADVGLIKLWDVKTGEEVAEFQGHSDEIKSLDFYPDGSRLVSSSFDNRVIVWDTKSKREMLNLFGFVSSANVVKFSPTGFYLLGGLENGQIKVWEGISMRDLADSRSGSASKSAAE